MKIFFISLSFTSAFFALFSASSNLQAMKGDNQEQRDAQFFAELEKTYKENKKTVFIKEVCAAAKKTRFDLVAKIFKITEYVTLFSKAYQKNSFCEKTNLGIILQHAFQHLEKEKKIVSACHILEILEAVISNTGIMTFVIPSANHPEKLTDGVMLQNLFVLFAKIEYTQGVKRLLENKIFSKLVAKKYLEYALKYYTSEKDNPTNSDKDIVAHIIKQIIQEKA